MYIKLDNEIIDIKSMTISFLKNALTRYEALCKDRLKDVEEMKKRKTIREALTAELVERRRFKFKPIKD